MEKKITDFTEIEIKAAIYDIIEELNKNNQTMKVLQTELDRRKALKEKPSMEETTNEEVIEVGGVHTIEEATETAE